VAFRPDVEGLRAVAVLLVVAFHAGLGLPGGFVGVDVFFVISGFLITSLLVDEVRATGGISLADFYARRARRILPAACLVLVVTAIVGALALPELDRPVLAADIRSSALFVANWHFAAMSTDYFAFPAGSFVLHYWSLSLEEQFYLLWPVLVLVVAGRRRTARRVLRPAPRDTDRRLWLTLAPIALVSLALSAATTASAGAVGLLRHPDQGLGTGRRRGDRAEPAVPVPPRRDRGSDRRLVRPRCCPGVRSGSRRRDPGAWCRPARAGDRRGRHRRGGSPHPAGRRRAARPPPAGGARPPLLQLVPVALAVPGTGATGVGSARRGRPPAAGRLGRAPAGRRARLARARGADLPVRRGARAQRPLGPSGRPALAAGGGGPRGRHRAPRRRRPARSRARRTTHRHRGRPDRRAVLDQAGPAADGRVTGVPAGGGRARSTDDDAAEAREDLAPSRDCFAGFAPRSAPADCRFGDPKGTKVVVLFGDSHAHAWFPALSAAARRNHWQLWFWAKSGCGYADVREFLPSFRREYTECGDWRRSVLARIDTLPRVDLVVVGRSMSYLSELLDAGGTHVDRTAAATLWSQGADRTLEALAADGRRIALLRDVPRPGFDAPACVSMHTKELTDCSFPQVKHVLPDRAVFDAEKPVLSARHVQVVDLTSAICPGDPCQTVSRAGSILYRTSTTSPRPTPGS
jgi:hypothetical protein